MGIFFWDFEQASDIVRQWSMFIFNIIVLIYTSITLFKTWKYYHRFIFQLMPLSVNVFATLVLLLIKLFEKGYQFDLVGQLIEIFTYFLFCYTFALIYTKVQKQKNSKRTKIIWNVILIIFFILLICFSILIFVGIVSKNCSDNQLWPAVAALVFQALSFIPTVYYGSLILKQLHNPLQKQEPLQSTIQSFSSDIYLRERKKQILIVLAAYILSLVLRIIIFVVVVLIDQNVLKCQQIQHGIVIITSDHIFGQIILVVAQINQLLPHIIIPIAMYIVPIRRIRRGKSIAFNQKLLLDDEEEGNQQDDSDIDQKISSMLSSRLSAQRSPQMVSRSRLKK